jgi:hypothetical protein
LSLVSQFIPGSRHFVAPRVLAITIVALLFGVSAFLLRDYRIDHFITTGVSCLTTGLICAAPSGLISAWILRRGFAVNPLSAGLALGILSGISGVAMLELHCANFQRLHLLWHLLVVPVAGIVSTLVGQWVVERRKVNDSKALSPSAKGTTRAQPQAAMSTMVYSAPRMKGPVFNCVSRIAQWRFASN